MIVYPCVSFSKMVRQIIVKKILKETIDDCEYKSSKVYVKVSKLTIMNKCIEVNVIVPPCEVISLHHIIAKNAPTTLGRQSTDNALFGRGFQKEKPKDLCRHVLHRRGELDGIEWQPGA